MSEGVLLQGYIYRNAIVCSIKHDIGREVCGWEISSRIPVPAYYQLTESEN